MHLNVLLSEKIETIFFATTRCSLPYVYLSQNIAECHFLKKEFKKKNLSSQHFLRYLEKYESYLQFKYGDRTQIHIVRIEAVFFVAVIFEL